MTDRPPASPADKKQRYVYDPDPVIDAEIAVEEGTATAEDRQTLAELKAAHEQEARESMFRADWLNRAARNHYRPTRGVQRVPCEVRTRHQGRTREARGHAPRQRGSRRGRARAPSGSSDDGPSDESALGGSPEAIAAQVARTADPFAFTFAYLRHFTGRDGALAWAVFDALPERLRRIAWASVRTEASR